MKVENPINSMVAGGSIKNSVNGNNNNYKKEDIIKEAQKKSFWTSLITGVIASLLASFLYNYLFN